MTAIRKLMLEDVRCFDGQKVFDIRPLTFLVGENSTGKSTALGCFQAAGSFLEYTTVSGIDFNEEPYKMGAFTDIVRRSNPKKRNFKIAFEFQYENEGKKESLELVLVLKEKEKGSEPIVQEYKFIFDDGVITFKEKKIAQSKRKINLSKMESTRVKKTTNQGNNFVVEIDPMLFGMNISILMVVEAGFSNYFDTKKEESKQKKELVKYFRKKFGDFESSPTAPWKDNVCSFAPIRSKPQRTYDPLKEVESPEGSDMPMVLMNMKKTDPEQWESIRDKLIEFGKASGLFTDIAVRKHGDSMSDPFQLQIKVNGPKVNLIDVGYGVSQILPILVRILNMQRETMFLLQQPEVHLHPRGQAELSSLLIANCQHGHSFIVETHSEYMINRACIEIRNSKIKHEDVSLIYLEAKKNKVIVHNITFDDQGNLENVPDEYNNFLMKETNRFIGLED